MRRDKRVFVLGEDVGVYGGAFKVTLGFQEEFGAWRVIDTPLSETAIVGGATGAAIMGMRPVAEMQFADFVSCAWDHLVTVAAKQRWRAGTPVPIVAAPAVRRRLLGRAVPLAEPRVVVRAHPRPQVRLPGDAGGREGPADRRDRGSEPGALLRAQAPVPPHQGRGARRALHDADRQGAHPQRGRGRDAHHLGRDGLHRRGGGEAAARRRRSRSSTCARSCRGTSRRCSTSVRKTSKVLVLHEDTRTGGFGAEIAATIAEEAFEDLDAPVRRIAAPDTPVPFSPSLEKAFIPQVDDVVRRAQGAGRVLMATEHRSRRRHAADGRLGLRGHVTKWLKQVGEHDRGRRDAARDLDRQGRHRGAVARHPASSPRSSSRKARRSRSARCSRGSAARAPRRRAGRARARRPSPRREAAPAARPRPPPAELRPRRRRRRRPLPPQPAAESSANGRTFVSPVVARIAPSTGSTRRRCRAPARRPRHEEGHPGVHRVGGRRQRRRPPSRSGRRARAGRPQPPRRRRPPRQPAARPGGRAAAPAARAAAARSRRPRASRRDASSR